MNTENFVRVFRAIAQARGVPIVAALAVLLAVAPLAHAAVVINFESTPSLAAQPNNFFAAGAMQTYTSPGIYSISGGVVLGNPSFLASFPAHGSAPNLYGTADFADPSLLSTITLMMPAAEFITSVTGVLFNGQTFGEDYIVTAFSGVNSLSTQTFLGVQAGSNASGFRNFVFASTLAQPITKVTVTTPN